MHITRTVIMFLTTLPCVVLLYILGVSYPESINLLGLSIDAYLDKKTLNSVWLFISTITSRVYIAPILAAVGVYGAAKSSYEVIYFLMASACAYFSVAVLKLYFAIPRPLASDITREDYAFPSGHTTMAVFFCAVLIYFVHQSKLSRWIKCLLYLIISLATIAVLISRITLGVHTLTDVLGGIIFGLFWAFTLKYFLPRS